MSHYLIYISSFIYFDLGITRSSDWPCYPVHCPYSSVIVSCIRLPMMLRILANRWSQWNYTFFQHTRQQVWPHFSSTITTGPAAIWTHRSVIFFDLTLLRCQSSVPARWSAICCWPTDQPICQQINIICQQITTLANQIPLINELPWLTNKSILLTNSIISTNVQIGHPSGSMDQLSHQLNWSIGYYVHIFITVACINLPHRRRRGRALISPLLFSSISPLIPPPGPWFLGLRTCRINIVWFFLFLIFTKQWERLAIQIFKKPCKFGKYLF